MTNRLKFPVLMLLITAIALTVLVSCTSVGIASVAIKEECDYKTEYVIGDELDLTGLELVVTRTDGEVYTVFATEVREDLKIMNFKTDKAVENLNVIIEYKGIATNITINISDNQDSASKYTVTFNTGEGEKVEPISAGEFASITAPTDPIREGYVFDGWYKESTYNNLWNFNVDKVVGDTTLYAKWSKLYTITFKYDPEYNDIPDVVKYVKAGSTLTDIPALPYVKGMIGSWDRTTFTEVYSNIVVNAQYVTATYKVVFYYMDGDGVTPRELKVFENVPYGTNLAKEYADEIARLEREDVPQYSEDGTKHFSGKWSQSFNDITSDLNVEALYEINKYDLTFYVNDDSNSVYEVVEGIIHNNPASEPLKQCENCLENDTDDCENCENGIIRIETMRPGYVFDGWYKNAEGTSGQQWNFNTDRVTSNTNVYAKWTKLFYVTYWVEDEIYQRQEVRENGNASRAPLPTKEGHTASWYIDATPLNNDSLLNVKKDIDINAKFTINSYTVTFYNFDREVIEIQSIEFEKSATKPAVTPKRLGYKFLSWGSVDEDGNEIEYACIKENTDVTAKFEADTFNVTIYPNVAGLANTYSITAVYDALISSSELSLNYEGYNFDGWYTDNAYTKQWNLGANALNVNAIVDNTVDKDGQTAEDKRVEISKTFERSGNTVLHLYAKWSKIHTVSYYDENNLPLGSKTIIDGNLLSEEDLPAIEKRESETGRWYVKGDSTTPFNFSKPITSELTLNIIFTTNVYIVNFYKGVGDFHTSIEVMHGETIKNTIPDPEVEGKIFKGWDKSLTQIIVEDTDFTALFEPVFYNVIWAYNGINYAITQVEHGKQAVFPATATLPVREGYKLIRWVPVSMGGGNALDINSVKSNMSVSPEWAINDYKVEFKDRETNDVYMQNDGYALVDHQIKSHGQGINISQTVPNPAKEGKDFIGWTIGSLLVTYNNDLNSWILNSPYGEEGTYSVGSTTASLIIKNNKYYYSFETPSTILTMIDTNWDEDKIIEISATELGWVQVNGDAIVTDYKNVAFDGNLFFVVTENIVVYSNHATSIYEVNYVTNCEDVIETDKYAYGSYSILPDTQIANDGYVFIGWYTEPEFKNKYSFGSIITGDMTLYARWEAEREYTENAVNYVLNEGGTAYVVTGLVEGFNGEELVIANFYGNPGLPVESIGAEAFSGNSTIKNINLPNTLLNIGPGAFMNMSALKSIDIPETIALIPDNAFNGATALETVSFGNYPALTTIGKNAFAKTSSLKYSYVDGVKKAFTLPESLTTIESGAFFNCTGLTEITIPENVIAIGDNAFAGANALRYVIVERETPANLGVNVFQNYTSLQDAFRIYVPSVAMYTSGAANANWKQLANKIYANTSILREDGAPEWAYTLSTAGQIVLIQYLGNMTEVTIPEFISIGNQTLQVAQIGDYAFDGKVTSVIFNASVAISANTFASTQVLTNLSITVGTNNAIDANYLYGAYSSVDSLNTLSVSPNTTISELFGGAAPTALTIVKTLPGANNVMSPSFLANCVYVKEVIINGRTENVSEDAFLNCSALEKVVFDNRVYSDVASIGANAFNGAISLDKFEILTTDGTSYGIPSNVKTIGANAFDGTKWLKANSSDMIIVGNGILYRYNGQENIVAIPSNVTAITANAFSGNAKLRQVYISDVANSKLVEIGESAFANCVNLESVVLPASLTTIGANAFEGDVKLASVVHFGNGEPENMGAYAFNSTHAEMKVYLSSGANAWSSLYASVILDDVTLFEEIKMNGMTEEKWVWIYSNAKGGNGIMIVKALGSIGGNTAMVIPEQLNGKDVYEIADYALPRNIERLEYSTFVKNVGNKPFGGVTFVKEITIKNSYNEHRTTPEAMMSLFTQNTGVSVLNTVASVSLKTLIGGILPANVTTVNVIESANAIAEGFLEDNVYVENINVTVFDKEGEMFLNPVLLGLEETASMSKAHRFTSIGAKAFRNTAWMNAYDGEYVIVLGGNLVDYKGVNSVLEIPANVDSINGSIFENDTFIEVVSIPASVTNIGDYAFDGTTNLTKIFINSTTAPTIYANTFDVDVLTNSGLEIYVPASALTNPQSGYTSGTWSGLNPLSDSGIVRIKNQISNRVFEEYIVNANNGELLLSRKYMVTYSGTLVTEIIENTTAVAPTAITDKSTGIVYNVTTLGNNVFMSAVENIVLDLSHVVGEYTFNNLGDIDTVTIGGIDLANRKLSGNDIINIFNNHNALNLAYDGSVTLTELVGQTGGINSLVGIKIIDGVKETATELLKGWTDVANVTFPQSIEKVGINALEDTSWYKNYSSTLYGNDFVVLGGSLLYKYKGAGTGLVTIPKEVKIINTGAFSSYDGSAWDSSLYVKQIRFGNGSEAHTILEHAFSGCSQLASILLPTSMSNIAESAFDNTAFIVNNGMLIVSGDNGQEATLVKFTGGAENLVDGTLTIPANVKKIAAGAFQNVTALKKITYTSDSILSIICEDAFNGATALETVQLPATVNSIGKNAFYNTLWLGKSIQSGADVMIGGVLYQRVTTGDTYTLYDNVISIVEDALAPIVPFTINGITYSTQEGVRATSFIMSDGAKLPQAELRSLLSKEWMTALRTNGQVTLSGLIGSDEPLDNITDLSFLFGTTSIAAGYAENWTNVSEVSYLPYTVTEIGENAFRGTAWFEAQNNYGFNFAGESRVIIKYVGDATDIVIGSYAGETVSGITADAFKGNETIKSITFGEFSTVSKIPAGAFSDCVNLENIVFNEYITEFGEDAFVNTAWLANYNSDFVIVDGVMVEYKGAGGAITIPKETTKIYPYVFRGNDTITSVTFDANCLMTAIDANTFRDCVNLEELIINEHIVNVDRTAVQGTKWLTQTAQSTNPILYYENVYYGIKRAVLYVGTSQIFTLSNTVTEITAGAFSGVTTLTQIMFSEGKLTSIPDGAFEGCTSLDEVTFANNIVNIGKNAFTGTPWLAKQSVEFVVKNGVLVKYNGNATSVVIPESVTQIAKGAFDNTAVVSIDMSGANVETILEGTFKGLSTLENVIFSSATTYVGEGAFNGTAYLNNAPAGLLIVNDVALIAYVGNEESVVIPEGVRYINADVFQGKYNLANVTLQGEIEIAPYAFVGTDLTTLDGSEYVVGVGYGAFQGTNYESIQVYKGFVVVNGNLVEYKGTDSAIVIPASVEYIPEGVFSGNTNITSLDFSKVPGPLSIEANAFRNAINLKEIVFSDNIEYVGTRAFYNTAWMDSYSDALIVSPGGKLLSYVREGAIVTIPNTVKTFARDVFKGNSNITTVQFASGSNVIIPEEAFKDCTSLLNLSFNGTFQIGKNAFQNTEWYKEEAKKTKNRGFIVINGMLIGYEGIATEIEIPSTVTYIYDYVFKGNENITSLSFASGSAITAIKGETFVGCTQLSTVTFRSTLVELDMGAFEGTAWKANLTTDFIVVGTKLLAYVGNGGDVVIPSGVDGNSILEMSPTVFQGNESITSISFGLGSYLSSIPANAFNGCVNLEKVTFPEGIEYVGQDAFKGTKWLEKVTSGNLGAEDDGEVIADAYVLDGTLLFYFGIDEEYLFHGTGVTNIARSAFEGSSVQKLIAYFDDPTAISVAEGALDSLSGIYVKDNKVESFRTAWSEYALKIFSINEL